MKQKGKFFSDALHIFILSGFAFAQPVFDLLSQNAAFLIARHSKPIDVIILIFILCVFIPAILIFIEIVAGLFGRRTRKNIHYIIVAVLLAIIFLPALIKIKGIPGTALLTGAVAIGIVVTTTYIRFPSMNMFMTILSPAILIFPGLFLFNSPIVKVVFPGKDLSAVSVKTDHAPPIVFVIFDEFNITSLMNENKNIDPIRYPNFAALAKDSTWFRNATTVSESSDYAVPVILSGKYPAPSSLPIASDHPNNIFTLLGNSYRLVTSEAVTHLCPESLCKEEQESLLKRMDSLLSDLSLVYLHIILPTDLTSGLPVVTQNWKDFSKDTVKDSDKDETWNFGEEAKEILTEKDRYRLFRKFITNINTEDEPALFFLHTMLPHVPYEYLPSGKTYNDTGFRGIIGRERWSDNEQAMISDYQRYLLQVGFVDSLLGELISRLKELDLYERSLIVITADHGVSFRPGDFRRPLTKTNFQDIMPIPLFIKLPDQKNGLISDRNVSAVDILPTIADILKITLPWPVDGHSAIDTSIPERETLKIFYNNAKEKLTVTSEDLEKKYDTLKSMLSIFGSGEKPDGLFRIGHYKNLIGHPLHKENIPKQADTISELDLATFYDRIDPEGSFIPVQITGRLLKKNLEAPLNVALAVNGTIQAVTEAYDFRSDYARFAAVVPETAFKKGKNNIEILLVSGNSSEPQISITEKAGSLTYVLSESENETVITASDGKSFMIGPHALEGSLDILKIKAGQAHISGWAADIKNSEDADFILVFVNNEFFYSGQTGIHRPGVVDVYGENAPEWSGYNFILPFPQQRDIPNPEVRVFAVSKKGKAKEFMRQKPPVTYTLTEDDKGIEIITSSEDRTFKVIPGTLEGFLEIVNIESDNVLVLGWAADIENSEIPENIVIFVNGQFFYTAPCNRKREDVAKAYGKSEITKSGFEYSFPVKVEEKKILEVRFFAISENGYASELIYPEDYKWSRKRNTP